MKNTTRVGWIFIAICSLYVLGQATTESDRQFEQIKQEITSKQSLRASKAQERAELRNQIESVEKERHSLQTRRVMLQTDLEASETRLATNTEEVRAFTQLRDSKTTELVWNTVTSQQLQVRNPLTMLIVQSDPLKVDRLYHYHTYFAEQLETQIDDLEAHLLTLEGLIDATQVVRSEFNNAERDFDANTAALQERGARLATLNRQLQGEIDQLDRDISQLVGERERLSQLIASRAATITRPQISPSQETSMWPVVGSVRQRFGALRADGRIRSEGIVIGATRGATVTAVAGGSVLFADWFEGYGNTIIIDHGNDLIAIYAFCDSLLKQETEPVEAGEVIATVGIGGSEDAAGLYFEIRQRNTPTDPLRWLTRR